MTDPEILKAALIAAVPTIIAVKKVWDVLPRWCPVCCKRTQHNYYKDDNGKITRVCQECNIGQDKP